ncbi:MAG: T9SS type A sorting domain-containing protein [Bacteroidetes bacterium]|nr:T9SS type A sorting domain-containing protein [Bacteroidota bacterium]
MASQSANINTTPVSSGSHNLVLSFDFMSMGSGLSDNASAFYSIDGGTNYTQLDASLKSPSSCGGSGAAIWARRSYVLPANCLSLSNFRVRFNWTNDDDGAGSDPSVAINNVILRDSIPGVGVGTDSVVATITLTPTGSAATPVITTSKDTICASDSTQICVTSTYASYLWNANGNNATTQCVFARNAGNYNVQVTDNNGCTAQSSNLPVTVRPQPSVSITRTGDTLVVFNAVSYQWYRNNVAITPGGTSQLLIASQPGSYTVEITDIYGCKATSTPIATAIHDLANDIHFELYPNPVSEGKLQVVIGKECLGCELQVFDATGRLVHQSLVHTKKSDIDVSHLAKGLYVVKLNNAVRQFIKE